MTTLSKLLAKAEALPRVPLRTIILAPNAFADTYARKPKMGVKVGLRLLAEDDYIVAREQGAKWAWRLHPEGQDEEDRIAAYNDYLVHWAVARGVCQFDNAEMPYFVMAEDSVREILTSDGILLLWEEIKKLAIELSPLSLCLTEADIPRLCQRLIRFDVKAKSPAHRAVSRLLLYCLDVLDRLESNATS